MTETTPSFAGTPDRIAPTGVPDVLSEMLRAVRLTGSVFFGGSFTAPFGVVSPGALGRKYSPRPAAPHQRLPPDRIRALHVRTRQRHATRVDRRRYPPAPVRRRTPVLAGRAVTVRVRAGHRPAGADRRDADGHLWRRRRGNADHLRLYGVLRISLHTGIPNAPSYAGRADRRREGRRAHGLDRSGGHFAGRRGDTRHADDARPDDGAVVRRGAAAARQPAAKRQQGMVRGAQ